MRGVDEATRRVLSDDAHAHRPVLVVAGDRVEAAGGTQVVEPDTVPGVGTVAYFKDTEGNILGALEPAEPFAAAG